METRFIFFLEHWEKGALVEEMSLQFPIDFAFPLSFSRSVAFSRDLIAIYDRAINNDQPVASLGTAPRRSEKSTQKHQEKDEKKGQSFLVPKCLHFRAENFSLADNAVATWLKKVPLFHGIFSFRTFLVGLCWRSVSLLRLWWPFPRPLNAMWRVPERKKTAWMRVKEKLY